MTQFNIVPFSDKHNSVLPSSRNNLLLLHPSAMDTLNLQKGSYVTLSTSNGLLLLKSWPFESIDPSDATLPAFKLLENYTHSQVSVELFKDSVLEANRVILSPIQCSDKLSHPVNSKVFKTFLKNELGDCYIVEGMVLKPSFCHFSNQSFVIKQIFSFNDNSHINKEKEGVKLSEMSFNDSFTIEENFASKCRINNPEFQSSTPKSSLVIPSSKKLKNLKPSRLCTNYNDFFRTTNTYFYNVTSKTNFVIEFSDLKNQNVKSLADEICGLEKQMEQMTSRINDLFCSDLKPFSRGLLISGQPGTGKSMVVNALQQMYQHQLTTFVIDEYEKFKRKNGIPFLKKIFKDASDNLPCIVFIEDVHKLCKNGEQADQGEKAMRDELPSIISNFLKSTSQSMVIATCEGVSSVFEGLRKHGILDEDIYFPVPSPEDRKQILSSILNRFQHKLTDSQILDVSIIMHGYVGEDLMELCRKAHHLSSERGEPNISFHHLIECAKSVKPKSMTEFNFQKPNVKWEDVGGMEIVKSTIIEMIEWPLKYPEKLKHFKIEVPRGVLMYGPPGCCKTMIVKALASESGFNFINIKNSKVFGKYVGDSEKSVSKLFQKARSSAPCVLFIDEIDSLASKRGGSCGNSSVSDRVLTQLLEEIDGVDVLEQGIYVIAATNRPNNIDPSLLRPGRFDRMIYVPLPDANTRKAIFEVILKKIPLSTDVDISYLVKNTEGYTGAEIAEICCSASNMAIVEDPTSHSSVVTMAQLLKSLKSVQPRTTKEMINLFETYHEKQL